VTELVWERILLCDYVLRHSNGLYRVVLAAPRCHPAQPLFSSTAVNRAVAGSTGVAQAINHLAAAILRASNITRKRGHPVRDAATRPLLVF